MIGGKGLVKSAALLLAALSVSGCSYLTSDFGDEESESKTKDEPKKVALILPMRGKWGQEAGHICRGVQGRFYKDLQAQSDRELRLLDSSGAATVFLYHQAVEGGSEIVVGPLTKMEIASINAISDLKIPVLALNNNAETNERSAAKNLYYFGPSPESEIGQLLERLKKLSVRKCAVIVDSSKYSGRLAEILSTKLEHNKLEVSRLDIASSENLSRQLCRFLSADADGNLCSAKIRKKMNEEREGSASRLVRDDLDAVVLLSEPATTAQLVPLLRFYYVENLPILGLSSSYDLSLNLNDLEGMEFLDMPYAVRPAMLSGSGGKLDAAQNLGGTQRTNAGNLSQARRLYAIGADAYWLASNFNRFMGDSDQIWQGASGKLCPTKGNFIQRKLNWIKVHSGRLESAD